MLKSLDATKLLMLVGGVAIIALVSLGAMFYGARQGPRAPVLPAIKPANIAPGFTGNHTFGLWTLICENAPQPGAAGAAPVRVCRVNARMMVNAGNQVLLAAGFNVVMLKTQPGAAILFRMPPAAAAADKARFAIDNGTLFTAPLRCTQTECIAQGALPEEAREQMRGGKMLSLLYTIKDTKGQPRTVRVDQLLHGFREAYDAMALAIQG